MRPLLLAVPLIAIALFGRFAAAGEPAKSEAFFHEQVAPILVGRCLECHGSLRKGGLDLRTRKTALAGGESGQAIEPGEPEDSLVYEYASLKEMPPKKPLAPKQVAILKKWIADGAYFPDEPLDPFAITNSRRAGYDWWSLKRLEEITPPDPDGLPAAWKKSPIDRFVFAKLVASGLEPSPPADPRTLLRRATYDLVGLPPTPEEVAQFLAECETETGSRDRVGEKAYEKLLDRRLASKHYGEQWGRHWLDVVRFGESNGFERNVITKNAWPFRDYVIRSLNEDKPFDRLVVEHLAGDAVGPDDPNVAVGTTFLVCGPYDGVGNQDPVAMAQIRANTLDEIIRATSEAFLGLTVGCSRCHDHKFDPISQRDYYGLYATFAGVKHGERVILRKLSERQKREVAALNEQIRAVKKELQAFEPVALSGRTILIDDEAPQTAAATNRGVTRLKPIRDHSTIPPGTARGFRDDLGDLFRTANVSRGRYHLWDNRPGVDLFCWNPAAAGKFRVWLSWGCGWGGHTPDAEYHLDFDGELSTKNDQKLIATVDQRYFAGGGPESLPKKHLWSGFLDAGVHEFGPASRIILRGGKRGIAATADIVVFQEEQPEPDGIVNLERQPRLRPAVHPKINSERIQPVKARFLRFTVAATNSVEPCIDELEVYSVKTGNAPPRNVAAATAGAKVTSSGNYAGDPKHQLKHVNDGKYGNSRSWISNQPGAGWVQIEFAGEQRIDRIIWGRDREQKYRDRLPTKYKIEVATEPGRWQVVASSADRLPYTGKPKSSSGFPLIGLAAEEAERARPLFEKLKSLQAGAARLRGEKNSPKWWVGNFNQANGPFHVFLGGSPQRKGEVVVPASMKAIAGVASGYKLSADAPEKERRLALAKWIVARDNPLTPRVLANRLWHYHFGTGIVDTPSDFGFMGGRPSHPELLDWLAWQLHDHSWRLKPLHKQIMLSQAYRQSSAYRPLAAKKDGDSRLLWRFPPRRLTGEEIRDTALAIAGKLDSRMGGSGFRLFKYVRDNVATYHPLDKHGPATYRRAVYHHRARAMQIDLMTEFDTPDCAFSAPRRASTTTPLQALTLLNHSFTLDMAAALAERLKREVGRDKTDEQVRRAFALAFSRPPDDEEIKTAIELIEAVGLRAFCRALLNASELIYLN